MPEPDEGMPELVLPIEERDHTFGPIGAKYTLVEYGSFANPRCAEFRAVVKELERELGDDLCFAFRHFPQVREYPTGQIASEAAEAAGLQAKFWLMHDRIFDLTEAFTPEKLRAIAVGLPLEMDEYDRDLRSGEAAELVRLDVTSAGEVGVADTPTLFVNGRMHAGSYEFLPLLDALQRSV
ncbi:MAG TPA: thioredoxin domain-containing protein [Thermoplasmata archaeon]|nr:thioredoxin domain-containing protein [Thermoplasmata archaeon]HTW77423.1 thioredoxin domain-containing protein [Thermoplasmata archaeon]